MMPLGSPARPLLDTDPSARPRLSAALAGLAGELGAAGGWLGVLEPNAAPAVLALAGDAGPLAGAGLGATRAAERGRDLALEPLPGDPGALAARLRVDPLRTLAVVLTGFHGTSRGRGGTAAEIAVRRFLEDAATRLPPPARAPGTPCRPARVPPPPAARLRLPPDHVAGSSPAMRALYRELGEAAASDAPVLVCGETGVGKEHVARALHLSSDRRSGPFVAINCAAIPGDLLEAEMFGIGEGVASGVMRREGCFAQAAGGTLLLDEIGELAPPLQVKLLRALQEGEIRPLGGKPRTVDVRVVGATNAELERRIAAGRFRADLYYRLAGRLLRVPPLRERGDDVAALALALLDRFAAEAGQPPPGIRLDALAALAAHAWPGNVRELAHEVRRLVRRDGGGEPIGIDRLSAPVRSGTAAGGGEAGFGRRGDGGDGWHGGDDWNGGDENAAAGGSLDLAERVERLERRLIREALGRAGSVAGAARLLGISRNGLKLKCRRLGVDL